MKYKYIVTWFYTPRDRSNNVYSYGHIVDTRSGRMLEINDCPESNLKYAICELNDGHKQNYYFTRCQISWREFKRATDKIPMFRGEIADQFRKMMKSRKKKILV